MNGSQTMSAFSIVIPTHNGQKNIASCFDSILKQDDLSKFDVDVIVVVDGANSRLEEIINDYVSRFLDKAITLRTLKFKVNKGRFEARLKGAKLSKKEFVLFIDDRNAMARSYLNTVVSAQKTALVPNVIETKSPNFIATTLYLLRQKIYGNRWGKDFKSYEINLKNFEKSSKGTTSFWVNRGLFLEACKSIKRGTRSLADISDDTKVLKYILLSGVSIYKSSEAKVYYSPRKSAMSELVHVYNRGPKFIDYYLSPGTRFFVPLVMTYFILIVVIFTMILSPFAAGLIILITLLLFITVGVYIAKPKRVFIPIILGIILLSFYFYAGILVGQFRMIMRGIKG